MATISTVASPNVTEECRQAFGAYVRKKMRTEDFDIRDIEAQILEEARKFTQKKRRLKSGLNSNTMEATPI